MGPSLQGPGPWLVRLKWLSKGAPKLLPEHVMGRPLRTGRLRALQGFAGRLSSSIQASALRYRP